MNTIGSRIKEARLKAGLKQADIVRAVGVSSPTVSDWEGGKIKSIEGENLIKLAKALRVSPEWLQTGKERTRLSVSTTSSYGLLEDNAELVGASNEPILDSDEAMLLRLFREMTDEQRAGILKNATDTHEANEKLLRQLLARKKA